MITPCAFAHVTENSIVPFGSALLQIGETALAGRQLVHKKERIFQLRLRTVRAGGSPSK